MGLLRQTVATISFLLTLKSKGKKKENKKKTATKKETNLIIDDGFRIIKDKISIIAVSKAEKGN